MFLGEVFSQTRKRIHHSNRKFSSPFPLHFFYILKTAYTIRWLRNYDNYDPLKQDFLFIPKRTWYTSENSRAMSCLQ